MNFFEQTGVPQAGGFWVECEECERAWIAYALSAERVAYGWLVTVAVHDGSCNYEHAFVATVNANCGDIFTVLREVASQIHEGFLCSYKMKRGIS